MHPGSLLPSNGARALAAALCLAAFATGAAAATDCTASAAPDCYRAFEPPQAGGALHYYASLAPGAGPTQALVAMHGHPRDAGKTFDAALRTVRQAGALERTLVVAPLFQVAADKAGKCSSAGVPAAQDGDLLWTCASWLEGGRAENGNGLSSFAAMDALVAELHRRWPSLRTVTLAGFSAGAQMVQHYIGFAADPPAASLALRYVVADPGTWLYFDAFRPFPPSDATACPALDRWKYGTEGLPAHLGRDCSPGPCALCGRRHPLPAGRARHRRGQGHGLPGARQVLRSRGARPLPAAARPGLRAVRPHAARAREAPRGHGGAGLRARRGLRVPVRGRARRAAGHALQMKKAPPLPAGLLHGREGVDAYSFCCCMKRSKVPSV